MFHNNNNGNPSNAASGNGELPIYSPDFNYRGYSPDELKNAKEYAECKLFLTNADTQDANLCAAYEQEYLKIDSRMARQFTLSEVRGKALDKREKNHAVAQAAASTPTGAAAISGAQQAYQDILAKQLAATMSNVRPQHVPHTRSALSHSAGPSASAGASSASASESPVDLAVLAKQRALQADAHEYAMLVLAMMEAPITQPEQNALYAQFQEEYLNVVAPQGLSVEEALSQRLANLTFLGDDTVTQEAQSPVVEEPLSYQELMRAADAFLVQYLRLNSDAQEEDIRNIHTNYVNSDAAGRAGMEEALAWQGIAQQAAPPRAQAQEVHPNSSRNPLIHSPMNHASTQIQLGMGQAPAVAEAHSGTMSREEYMRRIYCAHDGDESLVLAAGFAYEEAEENPDEMRQLINDLCEMEASKARNTPFSRRR